MREGLRYSSKRALALTLWSCALLNGDTTQGTLVVPTVSSRLGVQLAISGAFETGAHVDYYDIAPPQA